MSDQIQKRESGVQSTRIDSSKSVHQLRYRPGALDDRKPRAIIRSAKTATLLQLSESTDSCSTDEKASLSRRRRTLQPGGFIRSRMTAELLGVEPSGLTS